MRFTWTRPDDYHRRSQMFGAACYFVNRAPGHSGGFLYLAYFKAGEKSPALCVSEHARNSFEAAERDCAAHLAKFPPRQPEGVTQ